MVTCTILLVIAFYFDLFVLAEPMLYVILYVWGRREPDTVLNMFSFKFKALYAPWVYMAIRMVMGGSITEPLIGVAVGHLYYFLIEVLPVTPGYNLGPIIYTPKFCIDLVNYTNAAAVVPPPQPRQAAAPGNQAAVGGRQFPAMGAGGYSWGGGGRTLGTR